jgi:hypothetical protein
MRAFPDDPIRVYDTVPPSELTTGYFNNWGADIVPLERVDGYWMILNGVFPTGIAGSYRFYIRAQPSIHGKIGSPILLCIVNAEFQQILVKHFGEAMAQGFCPMIRLDFHMSPLNPTVLTADLSTGQLPWDKIQTR